MMERFAQIQRTGGPEVIQWADVPLTEPAPGEVRMRNLAGFIRRLIPADWAWRLRVSSKRLVTRSATGK